MAGADPDDVRDGGPCHENADNAVTASLSDVRLTSYGNGKHPDMDCIAPCHVWGQLGKRQFLMRSQIAIVRVTGSRRAMSVLVSRLEITE